MKSFQDKLCDVLTFIGLVAVIAGGICSLIKEDSQPCETKAANDILPAKQPDDQNQVAPDSLEAVQQREVSPSVLPIKTKKDTIPTDTVLPVQPTTSNPGDSVPLKDTLRVSTHDRTQVSPDTPEHPAVSKKTRY